MNNNHSAKKPIPEFTFSKRRDGHGVLKTLDGEIVYDGEWSDDAMHGPGTFWFQNPQSSAGDKFVGEFIANQPVGDCEVILLGRTYSGYLDSWNEVLVKKDNKTVPVDFTYFGKPRAHIWPLSSPPENKTGLPSESQTGTFYSRTRQITYSGTFNRDTCTGEGTAAHADGSTWHGKFELGALEGSGRVIYKDGSSFTGEFTNGTRNGWGVTTDARGKETRSEWVMGKKRTWWGRTFGGPADGYNSGPVNNLLPGQGGQVSALS